MSGSVALSSKRIIYYYQTFTPGLDQVLKAKTPSGSPTVSVINVSSIHFGTNDDGSPYIHLNNDDPGSPGFDKLWDQTRQAHQMGITVVLMVGGAGGAYTALFNNFDTYYGLLIKTLKARPWITGVDLDIEEAVSLENAKKLIRALDTDMGSDFIITMAPVASSLMNNERDPFSGFSYKDLFSGNEGKRINWFNGQFYTGWGGFNSASYRGAINNGYPPNKVVMGMVSTEFSSSDFSKALDVARGVAAMYPDFGGVFVWEYFNAPPGSPTLPIQWADLMWKALHNGTNNGEGCTC